MSCGSSKQHLHVEECFPNEVSRLRKTAASRRAGAVAGAKRFNDDRALSNFPCIFRRRPHASAFGLMRLYPHQFRPVPVAAVAPPAAGYPAPAPCSLSCQWPSVSFDSQLPPHRARTPTPRATSKWPSPTVSSFFVFYLRTM